ncbi:RNA 2',3'-cyclic phosphodiesterase [Fervidicoccus fontis]|uniref:RNA 2',3'-cyclic phosphodiesterase n=1 Tax=Fervidicoccus fontis TaxID=683846 RepID=A0A843A782_9CREN|nr:RNA 2',3'-cyclic phosphodiesterase [Fervidicoccus fontis]MBE9390515.1 RNA 2',3'-cyclic phosphodiesterase [Fervidicoccus fontis]
MVRTFVAIEVNDPNVVSKIINIEEQMLSLKVPMKVVEKENLHITLAFIGEISEDTLQDAIEAIKEIEHTKIKAKLKGIGAFPNSNSPRVVWIGVDDKASISIMELYKKVSSSLVAHKVPFEREKDFTPHLTIARIKGRENIKRLASFINEFSSIEIGEVVFDKLKLKKSTLTPKGPIYDDILSKDLREG